MLESGNLFSLQRKLNSASTNTSKSKPFHIQPVAPLEDLAVMPSHHRSSIVKKFTSKESSNVQNDNACSVCSCQESVAMLANVKKHIAYVTSCLGYVSDQIRSDKRIILESVVSSRLYTTTLVLNPVLFKLTQTKIIINSILSKLELTCSQKQILCHHLSVLR